MAADSFKRRLLKRVFFPLLNEGTYRFGQCVAKAWDIRRGTWSEPELDLIPFAVREGESALDIGANYGMYTYHLARAVGRSGRVYAFEPVPFTYETCKLVAKMLRFKSVELVPKGCSDRTGKVAFTVPVQESGPISGGLAHISGRNDQREGKDRYSPYGKTQEIWCDVVALDDFLPELSNLSFIKCDIEGADILALKGATRTIERNHPTVLCEINPWFLEGFGIPPQVFSDFFCGKGYTMYHYDVTDGSRQLRAAAVEALGSFSTHNYIFLHSSRQGRFAPLLGTPASHENSRRDYPS